MFGAAATLVRSLFGAHRPPRSGHILLCGPPRSGTTLACWLLNQLDNVVALPEPLPVNVIIAHSSSIPTAIDSLRDLADATRDQIRKQSCASAKLVDGALATNLHEEPRRDGKLRDAQMKRELLAITKPLNEDFALVIKHPALFMAMLPHLINDHFTVFAMVRHPLAILGSWNTLNVEFFEGRSPVAEAFAPELTAELAACPDRIDRQVRLLSWYFARLRMLPRDHVVHYEDLVDSHGAALAAMIPSAARLHVKLERYDPDARYAAVPLAELRQRLEPIAGNFKPFYEAI